MEDGKCIQDRPYERHVNRRLADGKFFEALNLNCLQILVRNYFDDYGVMVENSCLGVKVYLLSLCKKFKFNCIFWILNTL